MESKRKEMLNRIYFYLNSQIALILWVELEGQCGRNMFHKQIFLSVFEKEII